MYSSLGIAIVLCLFANSGYSTNEEEWKGRWFPERPNGSQSPHALMGVPQEECDDGIHHLNVDYDGNPSNYTCFDDRDLYLPNPNVHPLIQSERIPKKYHAMHFCMDQEINYKNKIPTFGPHRPLWAMYGEYLFLPKQRWMHNLEHGSVVMLYHPCANKNEVKFLKKIVKSCLFRHIITASKDLTPERPMALITWGHRMLISKVDMASVVHFMKTHANHAPEKTAKEGQFTMYLTQRARLISNQNDTEICPSFDM